MKKPKQIFHSYELWECFKAGLYETTCPPDLTPEQVKNEYKMFLADIPRFQNAMSRVFVEWPHSCEQFLTNEQINRVAWLGQASMCIETGISSAFRGGFKMLSAIQQQKANIAAEMAIKAWEKRLLNGYRAKDKTVHQQMEIAGIS